MLDLKFLEALVDEALSNETETTLTEWLLAQRSNANLFSYFGQGDVENISCFSCVNFEVSRAHKMEFSNVQQQRDVVNNYADSGLSNAA